MSPVSMSESGPPAAKKINVGGGSRTWTQSIFLWRGSVKNPTLLINGGDYRAEHASPIPTDHMPHPSAMDSFAGDSSTTVRLSRRCHPIKKQRRLQTRIRVDRRCTVQAKSHGRYC